MPKIDENLWIAGGYYVDVDDLDQLRIIGPNNHLYMGLIDIPLHKLVIKDVVAPPDTAQAIITGSFASQSINLYQPAMEDMRTIRELISHPSGRLLTFLDLRRKNPTESVPMYVRKFTKNGKHYILFRRNYGNDWYATTWEFPGTISIREINHPYRGYKLTSHSGRTIPFVITAETNDFSLPSCACRMLPDNTLDWSVFGEQAEDLKKFWNRTQIEIEHLLMWKKTSGDRFGTIFPRDWMESILLGHGDIQQETIDHMLTACLAHVDAKGRGWHEDVVGEYKYEHELAGKDLYDRKMIDIEPLYFLCLQHVSPEFWKDTKAVSRLQRVAHYLLNKALRKPLITFKKLPKQSRTKDNEYCRVGDWRDSNWGYKQIHPVLAPFSVNVSHYPYALRALLQFKEQLKVPKADVQKAIKKWVNVPNHYHYVDQGKLAYALAVYDIREGKTLTYKRMEVRHLDEAYLFALGERSEQEVVSFASALCSDQGFATASGPTIVAHKNAFGYTTNEYHGLVIWTKQAAFAVKGLAKHRRVAANASWKKSSRELIDTAFERTASATLNAFLRLHAIPEVHYDDAGTPRFFTEQQGLAGHMSKVQLWSSVGFRRIVRNYHDFLAQKGVRAKKK